MKWIRVLLIFSFILVSGCSRKIMMRKYYILEYRDFSPQEKIKLDNPFEYNVDVREFRVAKAFEQTRIALRSGSNELNYYFYHQWAVRPSTAVAEVVYDIINKADIFNKCFRGYSTDADFLITGEILAIERIESKKKGYAHLNIIFNFVDRNSGRSVLAHEFDRKVKLADRKMNTFAHVVSSLLCEGAIEFINRVVDFLNKRGYLNETGEGRTIISR